MRRDATSCCRMLHQDFCRVKLDGADRSRTLLVSTKSNQYLCRVSPNDGTNFFEITPQSFNCNCDIH